MKTIILMMLVICLEVFSATKNTFSFKNGKIYMGTVPYTTVKDIGGGEIRPMFGDYDEYIGMGYYITPKLSKRNPDGSWVDVPVEEYSLTVWKEVYPDKSFTYSISFEDNYQNTGFYHDLKRYFDEEEKYHIKYGTTDIEGIVNIPWVDNSLLHNVSVTRALITISGITDKMFELLKYYQEFTFEISTEEGTYRMDVDLHYLDPYLLKPIKVKSRDA